MNSEERAWSGEESGVGVLEYTACGRASQPAGKKTRGRGVLHGAGVAPHFAWAQQWLPANMQPISSGLLCCKAALPMAT